MSRFDEFCKRSREFFGEEFKAPTNPHLIVAYNKGPDWRVKVEEFGEARWGRIGISCGPTPTFILLPRFTSDGGAAVGNTAVVIKGHRRKTR